MREVAYPQLSMALQEEEEVKHTFIVTYDYSDVIHQTKRRLSEEATQIYDQYLYICYKCFKSWMFQITDMMWNHTPDFYFYLVRHKVSSSSHYGIKPISFKMLLSFHGEGRKRLFLRVWSWIPPFVPLSFIPSARNYSKEIPLIIGRHKTSSSNEKEINVLKPAI